MIHKLTRVYPESGDWEAWYLNGKLIAEGHSVDARNLLEALADVFLNEVKSFEISDELAEQGFPTNLEDMLVEELP